MKVLLIMLGVLTPIETAGYEQCEALRDALGRELTSCIGAGSPTPEQAAHMKARVEGIAARVQASERRRKVADWCVTVALNGAYPGRVHGFADKREFWPEGRKPSVGECLPLVSRHYLKLPAADLRRGYTGAKQ